MSYEDYAVHRRSIGNLFDETHAYTIPPYQRNYSWDVDNATRLFKDLVKAAGADSGSPDSTNLLGAMVVVPEESGSPRFEVVDGQQRLATTALIFCAMRSYLHKFKDAKLPGTRPALENALDTLDNILNMDGKPRIELGKDDHELFSDILSTDTNDYEGRCKELLRKYKNSKKRILESNSLLISNYRALSKLVEGMMPEFGLDAGLASQNPDEFSKAVNEFSRHVSQKFVKRNHFAFIVVHNRYSAYRIFTTFNSTGQQLLQADLIKSHLLSKADSDRDKKLLQDRWHKVFDERLEDYDRFLYESMSSRHSSGRYKDISITTDNLYHLVESMVEDIQGAIRCMENFEEDAKIIKQMDYPGDLPEDDNFEETQSIFYRMRLLNARYIRVPMLAAGRKWGCLDRLEFKTLAECLLTFFFTFKFINNGTAEDVRSISNRITKELEEDADLSKLIYIILVDENVSGSPRRRVDEEDFKNNFQEKMFHLTANAAKYVLASMEIHMNRDPEKPHPYPKHTFELEHILPKNDQAWDTAAFMGENPSDDDINKYKNRLGNLTLLSRKWNRVMGAKRFEEKLQGYKDSGFELNKQYLNDYSEWTASRLEDREARLCELALKTWSLRQYDSHLHKHGYRDRE